jgi:hypothetical protein
VREVLVEAVTVKSCTMVVGTEEAEEVDPVVRFEYRGQRHTPSAV